MPAAAWGDILLGLGLAAAAGAAVAWILRGAGIAGGRPAAAVVGGIIAGVLLGPAVMGRAAPALHERLYLGAVSERRFLDVVLARHSADMAAQRAVAPDPAAFDELRARHARERAGPEKAHRDALAHHRSVFVGSVLYALAVAAGAAAMFRRRARPGRWAAVPLGAAAALAVELAAAAAVGRWVFALPWPLVLGLAAAGACGTAFAAVPMRWVARSARSGQAFATGTLMFLAACTLAACAGRPLVSLAPLAPVAAFAMALMLRRRAPTTFRERRPLSALLWGLVIPAVVAVGALHIEWWRFAGDPRAWPLVAAVALLSGNAAMLGLWAGLRAGGVPARMADLVDWHAAGFGATQACLAVLLIGSAALDPGTAAGSAVLAGLLISAAVGETTLSWMRSALRVADAGPAGDGARPPGED